MASISKVLLRNLANYDTEFVPVSRQNQWKDSSERARALLARNRDQGFKFWTAKMLMMLINAIERYNRINEKPETVTTRLVKLTKATERARSQVTGRN